jgi:hypothetical protein
MSLKCPRCFRLKCLLKSPRVANGLIRFSPKHRKQTVGLFSLNSDSVAAFSACFSASMAAICGLMWFTFGARPSPGRDCIDSFVAPVGVGWTAEGAYG